VLPQATLDHYRAGQRLTVVGLAATRRAWARMGDDFDHTWAAVGPRLIILTSSLQLAAAREGAAYVPRVLAETGQPDDPAGDVNPRALAGVAADGRSLDGLLVGSVVEAKTAAGKGATPQQALAQGGRWLDMAVQGIVADAARGSAGVGIAARPQISGWVRMLNPPSCSRCAILAGKHFKWNKGFQRHPHCDCRHIPASEDIAGDFRTNPDQAAREGHVTDLRPAEKKALAEGADLSQLVNARRGKAGLGGMTTTEGATRRGLAGKRLGAERGRRARRLTPEGIYDQAGDDRAEAIRLLRQHGYLI
jgi:hypothetical protein